MNKPIPDLEQALGHQTADKRIDILKRIGEVGSISEAARGAGVSYKAAWQAVEILSNLAGTALVEKAVGGTGGGGARLTEAGRQLLEAAELLNATRTAVLARLADESEASAPLLAGLGLRTSMRNQLPCTVREIGPSNGALRVVLELGNGATLSSRITRESAELLDLKPGTGVLALCKATAVTVGRPLEARDGLNLLHGTPTRMSDDGDGEVSVQLLPGLQLVGFARAGSGLKLHEPAMAAMDEAAVVIALPG